eukprot:gene7225-332_t
MVWYFNFSADSQRAFSSDKLSQQSLDLQPDHQHVLVTGGAGFIGSHATLELLERGHTVTVIDNLSRGNIGALFQPVDLGDKAEVVRLMKKASPPIDTVMHFAAVAYVGESMHNPLMYYNNISANTINLLDAMRQANIKRLVYSSTCAVYGNVEHLPITELTPPQPINPYGHAKLFSEDAIRAYAKSDHSFNAIILRYFNVYGSDPQFRLGEWPRPELRSQGRISGACLDAAHGDIPHLVIRGTQHHTPDGTCVRDYVHVSDLVAAHIVGLDHMANPPALYNVGTGRGVSVRQFVDACRKATGKNIQVVEEAQARPGDYAAVYADVSKIERDLNWRAKFTHVEEGLAHAWGWRKLHPKGYNSSWW